ncbi:hypothetical protein MTO96_029796 [Rhipicephalus appendiculatus]
MLSLPTHAVETFITGLPYVASIEIFRRLDIESLLNLAEAVPECKWLAFSPTVVRNVTFEPDTDVTTIMKFLQATRGDLVVEECLKNDKLASHVRELHLTNCVALSSNVVLECAERCNNLRELNIVNCLADPVKLFRLLCLRLTSVKKLEWSLHYEHFYKPWLDSHTAADIETIPKLDGPKLKAMYVEYEHSEVTVSIMDSFVMRCPGLHHLHMHHLTELNLSTSHFELGSDCSFLLASKLHKLRSLTLPPCGANLANCLEHLASGCKLLERLEVRSTHAVDWAASCKACKHPLKFTATCFELLHRETRLRRLSIDETARIRNLTFLIGCRVDELQLSLDNVVDAERRQRGKDLGRLLAVNPRLHSLTLTDRKATLCPDLAGTLSEVRSLRHLCVITTTINGSFRMAKDFFVVLEDSLPGLRLVHVHHMFPYDYVQCSTWVRQRRLNCSTGLPTGASRSPKGVVFYSKPCMRRLCCVDSFTGLVRPRNRF